MEFQDRVKSLVYSVLEKRKDLFLIELVILPDNAIRVVIDGDNGVSITDCIEMSRDVEHQLDREEQDFSLEVTSYGATEPLFMVRQFVKNVGRTLKVKVVDTKEMEGTLKSADENSIILETKTREPKPIGKGKVTVIREHKIALEDIEKAKIVIKF